MTVFSGLKISNFLPTYISPHNYTSKFLSSSTDLSMLMTKYYKAFISSHITIKNTAKVS